MNDPVNPAPVAPPAAPAPANPSPAGPADPKPGDVKAPDAHEVNSLRDSFFKLRREVTDAVTEIKSRLAEAKPVAPAPPPGVEARQRMLETEVQTLKRELADKDRRAAVLKSASDLGVAGDRLDFLEFRLGKLYPQLTAEGVPDPQDPAKKMTVPFIVKALIESPEGAAFRPAPSPSSLPAGGPAAPKDQAPEYTIEDFEQGRIPVAVRKSGNYRLRPPQ